MQSEHHSKHHQGLEIFLCSRLSAMSTEEQPESRCSVELLVFHVKKNKKEKRVTQFST